MAAPAFVRLELMDLPALQDAHVNVPGFYIAGTMEDMNKKWGGYVIVESNSETTGFAKREGYEARATIGDTIDGTVIKDSSEVDYRLIDNASIIYITMCHRNDTLESVTEDEMLAGKNRFLVGKEVIGAANCVLITSDYEGRKTYALSGLARGLKDTIAEMDTHSDYERFVHLDGPGIYFFGHSHSRIGEAKYITALSGGQSVGEVGVKRFKCTGKTVAPFRPVVIAGTRNVSNDLTVTWEMQTRITTLFLDQGAPFLDENERYKILVLASPTSATALRETIITVDVDADRTWTYTAANQLTDSITPGDPVTIEIVQLSKTVNDSGNRSVVTL